ncbi:MAG: TrbG/VirB9 family P-type conjugative transfer protein [Alphaproteobacteria bacterium]|nr:TrbG/VirB9 family P-type conjugative transfer protein [Alphaproteobacteria bacterium]
MKHRILWIAPFLLLSAAPAMADGMPELPLDDRIKIFTYSPADVYTLPTKYGYQTSVVFARNEEIKTVSVGDRSLWQLIPAGNRMFIRPMDDGLSTNMTVITNIREYNFDLKSVAEGQANNLYVVQFRYPERKSSMTDTVESAPAPAPAATVTDHVAIPPLDTQRTSDINENYSYTGPDELAPLQVYDDGKKTYVVYSAMPAPAPVPMVTSTSGQTATARHTVSGNKITIHTVASGFVLQSPAGQITVYNELFHP